MKIDLPAVFPFTLPSPPAALAALALGMLLSSGAGGSRAATFYLNAQTGDDGNTGTTPQQAWRSLSKINALDLKAGDEVVLASGGEFRGSLELKPEEAGTPSHPIVIRGDGPARATILSPERPAITLAAGGIEIRDLVLKGGAAAEKKGQDGLVLLAGGRKGERYPYVHIENVEISGFGGNGLSLGSTDDSMSGFEDVLISHVSVHDNFGTGIITYDKVGDRKKGYAHRNVVIRDCDLSANGSGSGLILSGIERGLAEYCRADANSGAGGGVGIWAYAAKNIRFRYCIASGTRSRGKDGGGFDLDGACVDCMVESCLAYENDGPGYMHCDYPTSGKTQGNVIRASVSINDGRQKDKSDAVGFGFVTWGDGLDDCHITNTLTLVTKDSPKSPAGGALFVAYIPGSVQPGMGLHIRGCSATHNRVVLYGTGPALVYSDLPDATEKNVRFAGNSYQTGGLATPLFVWNDKRFASEDEWHRATGQESGKKTKGSGAENAAPSPNITLADYSLKDPHALPNFFHKMGLR